MKAVLFDLDGTLWGHTAPPDFARITQLQVSALASEFEQLDAPVERRTTIVEAVWSEFRAADERTGGEGTLREVDGIEVVRAAVARYGLDIRAGDAARWWDVLHSIPYSHFNIRPYGDAIETLQGLRALGLRIGIVTNQPMTAAVLVPHLDEAGLLAHIDTVVTAADVGYRKPHPSVFLAALEALEVAPSQAIMVGDSFVNDVIPAMQLGMTAVLKAGAASEDRGAAPFAIAELAELLALEIVDSSALRSTY